MIKDNVKKPKHYVGKYEAMNIFEDRINDMELKGMEAAYYKDVMKYLWRYKHKNGHEDLKKAKWFMNALIAAEMKITLEELFFVATTTNATVRVEFNRRYGKSNIDNIYYFLKLVNFYERYPTESQRAKISLGDIFA